MSCSARDFIGLWPLLVVLLWGLPSPATIAASELDLETVIRLALERNPGFREVMEVRREVEAGVLEARAGAWPEVDLKTSWARSRDPSFLTGADFAEIIELFPGFEPQEQEIWSLAFEVRQALYSSGKVRAGIEAARLVAELAEARVDQARLDTALLASEAFFEAQAARQALAAVERQEVSRKESLAVAEARFELGDATRLEQLRAVAALAAVVPEVARFRGASTVARSRLRRLLSLPPDAPVEIVGASPPETSPTSIPTIDFLLDLAWTHRPELRGLRLQEDLLDQQQTVTRADGRPQLELTGRFGRRAREIDRLEDPRFDDWRLAVGLSWSLFDGGRRRGQIAQLESQKSQVAWQLEALEHEIAFEITTAHTALETALLRLEGADTAAVASSEATRVARESYREGAALLADLLAAQEQEIDAELERIEASRVARIEAVRLRRASGRLPLELPARSELARSEPAGPASEEAASRDLELWRAGALSQGFCSPFRARSEAQ